MRKRTQKLSRPIGKYVADIDNYEGRKGSILLKALAILSAAAVIVTCIIIFGQKETVYVPKYEYIESQEHAAVTGREVVSSETVYYLPDNETEDGIISDTESSAAATEEPAEESVKTPGIEATGDHLWDLQPIDIKKDFYSMFSPADHVNDYTGTNVVEKNRNNKISRAVFTVKGDGIMDCYRHGATFFSDGEYAFIEGHICLSDDIRTLEAVETGFITLVILDSKGEEVARGPQLDSFLREADFWLRIKGMTEFTIAVDCTDGRADGDYMTMIVEGLKLTK